MEVAEDPDQMVVQEYPPFVRIYKSGRVERLKGNDVVPASVDSSSAVSSKDVAISGDVSARLFLPNNNDADPSEEKKKKKLPVLLYVHGGGFVIETPFSPAYHAYVGSLAAAAGVVAVSVHYRRAPEHPLPAAYDDAWTALAWVASHADGAGPEPWLADHADCTKVFLAGDSAGGNIVHDLLLRAGEGGIAGGIAAHPPVGAVLVHPYFWGARPTHAPPGADPTALWPGMEKFWKFVCPNTTGEDDPRTNPHAGGPAGFASLAGKRVLVCLAEKDFLTVWGRMYCDALGSGGYYKGTVEMLESEGEGHVFHLFNPECQKAKEMMSRVVDFINRDD
ncbi:hypothetical protein H6P81_015901 [Aristolochia fimbriata]|uniref:Alpha/beta hydrolase fold-3 domain-containing protein n=1 Tax=Aristolochia fimbriata TaxID=158543 RepID=A0AAV7E833_ARIFI|nr:hypothetical protein H6P81_015901 [Aristolochia fimbriata]